MKRTVFALVALFFTFFATAAPAQNVGQANDPENCKKSIFPATGQTMPSTADTLTGAGTAVADDGTVQAGGPLRYRDNGDGTITDLNTRLMWEKKAIDGSLHDVNVSLLWSALGQMTIWDWLAAVNAEGGKGFAGHSDWRIPNVKELQSLVDYSVVNSSTAGSGPNTMLVDPAFNTPGMFNGCTLSECSVTGQRYQSSTHAAGNPGYVWGVDFAACYIGVVGPCGKTQVMGDGLVRAVRGGCVSVAPRLN